MNSTAAHGSGDPGINTTQETRKAADDGIPHLPPLSADVDMERYEALAGVEIRGFSRDVSDYALEVSKRLWCRGPEQCTYSERDGIRTVARYLAREAERTGTLSHKVAFRRANVDRYIHVLSTRQANRSVRLIQSQLHHVGRLLYPREYPARQSLEAPHNKRIAAASWAHIRDLYRLAPTLPTSQSQRLLMVLDLCYGAGARSADFKVLKGNSITQGSWGDEPVAVVRLPNRAGGTRLVPVADPEISERLLRRARERPSAYLLAADNADTVERNATNRVGEHLRAHGHRSINVAALRNRWLLDIAATVPAALMLQLADVTTAQILADQRHQLPTYGLQHTIAITKETYR